ncbi:MAG: hypothetical protein RXR08_14260 [Sulfolobaceae archaeon]
MPHRLDIIRHADVLCQVKDPLLSLIYRDPWTINFVKSLKDLEEKAYRLCMVTKALIGEIFEEDERQCRFFYNPLLFT